MYKGTRKEDLLNLLNELGEPVNPETDTIVQLKNKIESSQIFKDDATMVTDLLVTIVEDRKSKSQCEAQKLELEKVKLAQLEKQLEIENARSKSPKLNNLIDPQAERTTYVNNLESLIKSVRTLTIPVPEKPENINLFFQTLERAFLIKNVPEDLKSEILINILAEKLSNILCYISNEDLKNYEKVKNLVLKEHQPTSQECFIKFQKATREPNETHTKFVSRLNGLFRYYIELRNVNDFESLCDLIIHDKFFQTLDKETASHISIKEGENWLKSKEIAKECDIFFVNRGKSLTEIHPFTHPRERFVENRKYANFHRDFPHTRNTPLKTNKEKQISCYICSGAHFARFCPKRVFKPEMKKDNSRENGSANSVSEIETSNLPHNLIIKKLEFDDILLDKMPVRCLIDSGCSLLVINKSILPHPKPIISQITLTSCFKEKKSADLSKFMLSWGNNAPIEIVGAICENLSSDVIIHPDVYEMLKKAKKEKVSDTSTRAENELSVCNNDRGFSSFLFNENNSESNSFLSSVCNIINQNEYDLCHITDTMLRNKLDELIKNYKPNKTETTNLHMSIILTDDLPVCQRSRRLSFAEKQEVEKQIDEWLEQKIIRESCSDYCSPIVLCRKKNGDMRLCIDYRQLNKKTIKDKYPLPIIEELFDKLGNGKVFTTLDLKNAFFHVDIDEKSRKYTSFVTDTAQYEFLKVPFGLCNSPSVFQRYVNNVFKNLLKDGTLIIYLDDIIIPAKDEYEGLEKLTRVLETASKFGLELNLKKCQFMKRKIDFLGHIIENGTIRPSVEKTMAVRKFPEPKNAKEVQSFLGLSGYFRKYIFSYAIIAKPLSDLLRASTPFKFEQEQKLAFQQLKDILCKEPVLHLFKQGAKLELHTDASKLGFGAILLQQSDDGKLYPIHYMSKKTSVLEEKYCSYELEVLAIIEALKKFRNYLLGSKFKIYTDCSAFTTTLSKKELTPKVARWTLLLQEFDYEVVHRPGKQMQHVDALSRHPVMVVTTDEITHKIIIAQESDEYIKTLKNLLQQGQINDYVLKNNVLYKIVNDEEVLVVPEMMQVEVVKKCHSLGHFSVAKTEDVVKRDFYFPNIKKCIENVVKSCIECILVNKKRGKGEGFLNPIPKEDIPLSTYHIDFVGPLPTTNKKYNHIFTVIDAFTKFAWIYPVKTVSSHDAIQRLKQQQAIFGNPSRIISDRGTAFTSKEFKDYCEFEDIEHLTITTGVPRGNGQIERLHGTIIPVLSKLSIDEPEKWFKYVDVVQRTVNSTISRSTKRTPFELLTGTKMRNREEKRILEILEEERINSMMDQVKTIREEARKNILKVQEENKRGYNKKRKKAHIYKKGDLVAVQRTQYGTGMKLKPKFLGPYAVVRVKPNDRYDVRKVGEHDGPMQTSASADHMKLWN